MSKKIELSSLSSNSLIIHTLIVIFGISAWLGINGIFVQLPLIVSTSPEKWSLPMYLVTIIQSSNIGPIIYTLFIKKSRITDETCILIVLIIGTCSMGLMSYFYDVTASISGNEYSIMLFILVFFTAIVGCTSSVLFMPYLKHFNAKYLASYFIGEGLSGVIPSVIALIQGAGDNCAITPLFSPRIYFIILFIILLLSLMSFFFLNSMKNKGIMEKFEFYQGNYQMKSGKNFYLHVLVSVICFLSNGFLPGIQAFSCMPYGTSAYHLAVTLSNIANPLACFLHFWISFKGDFRVINLLVAVSGTLAAYVTFLAIVEEPPLRGDILGSFFLILSWVSIMGIISWTKLGITSIVKEMGGENSLVHIGSCMQGGSAVGAVSAFLIITFSGWFQNGDECT